VELHGTQPSRADTDADGLDDGREINETFTDPVDPDMDDDGALDGQEDVAGSDPRDRDSDDDGLTDGDEINVFATLPIDADTDAGGMNDGAEVGSGLDPLVPGDDNVCSFGTTGVPNSSGVPGLRIQPVEVDITWSGIINGGQVEDYTFQGQDRSARLTITFIGATGNEVCDVEFDISGARSARNVWTGTAGNVLFNTFELDLGGGSSDCPPVDPGFFAGFSNLRTLLQSIDWGIGYGPIVATADPLEDRVDDNQIIFDYTVTDYDLDVEPYVMGAFLTADRDTMIEQGWAIAYETTCQDITLNNGEFQPLPRSTVALPQSYVEARSLEPLPILQLIGFVGP